jgi:hypothetical protein
MSHNSIFRKIVNLILLAIIISFNLPAHARINASQVEFISGSEEEMNLFILDQDIAIDLGKDTARLRMLMDVDPLMVQNSYPQSFKVVTYSFDANEDKVLQSTVQHTVKRKNRSRVRFTLDLGYVAGDQDFYFEFYDSADRLVNTYRQTVDFSNLQEQIADTTPIAAADCDNTSFNDCHLDYIMEKINFLLEPKNTNYSNKIKNPNGSYNVVLSIPKSVKEQIIRGNFDVQAAALGNLGAANGDDLGNDEVTENLQMKGFDIVGVGKITAQNLMVMNGATIQDLFINGNLTIADGAANGYVLMSDSNGNATWQSLSAAMNGDNLGNHMATQDLDMKNFNIVNADLLEVASVKINGALAYTNGAVDGYVLTSDSNGNGHWRPVSTVVNGDGLGNHVALIDLDMNNNDIVGAQQINADTLVANSIDVTTVEVGAQIHSPTLHGDIDINGSLTIPDNAAIGKVLTSDANGVASWQVASAGSNGDNLGDHVANMDLNMLSNSINHIFNLTMNGALIISSGAAAGHLLTSDVNGLASWQAAGAADNLGDHLATMDLNMNGNNISSIGSSTFLAETSNASTVNIDWSITNKFVVDMLTTTIINFTVPPNGTADLTLVVRQSPTGHSIVLPNTASIKWPGGTPPSLTMNGNSIDVVDCLFDDLNSEYLCNARDYWYQ